MSNSVERLLEIYPDAYEVFPSSTDVACLYILLDPRTSDIRYVGKATVPIARLDCHLSEARSNWCPDGRDPLAKNLWVRELLANGLKPRMIVLRTGPAAEILAEEKELLRSLAAQSEPLINPELTRRKPGKASENDGRLRQNRINMSYTQADGRLKANRDKKKALTQA